MDPQHFHLVTPPQSLFDAGLGDDPSKAAPLRRGDACLYCRKRRIRCSATKPSCHHCTKLQRECVYDASKPLSRIRKLENRIHELEGHLSQALGALNASGARGDPLPSTSASAAAAHPDYTATLTATPNLMHPSQLPAIPGYPNHHPHRAHQQASGSSSGSASGQNNNPTPFLQQQPLPLHDSSTAYHFPPGTINESTVDITMLDNFQPAPGMRQMADRLGVATQTPMPYPPVPPSNSHMPPNFDWDSVDTKYMNLVNRMAETGVPDPEPSFHDPYQPHPHGFIPPPSNPLVGGWYDAHDLPKPAQDELITKFFGSLRTFARGYHIPRFMASLTLPPARRPHPCLLYSMYLIVSRFAPSPKLRKLEQHFFNIATTELHESIRNVDRCLDAVRAATIISVYHYSLAQYQAGTMMTSTAAKLAVSCGLHQIPTSVWHPSRLPPDPKQGRLLAMMRQRAFLIGPPVDSVDLAARIWAFWSLYIIDRTCSIASQWPPNIPDYEIITPYPKPLYEYEVGLVSTKDDFSIASLWDDTLPQPILPVEDSWAAHVLYIQALALLERASKLMYLPPERESHSSPAGGTSNIDEYLHYQNFAASQPSAARSPQNPVEGSKRCARVRVPRAYEEVRQALLRCETYLPPERRTPWGYWDDNVQEWYIHGIRKDSVTLHFLLGCAWMFLFDVYSYQAENHEAVAVARRLACTIRYMMPGGLAMDLDVFVTMCWSFVSMTLIREVKRLQAMGDEATAAVVNADVETVLDALKIYGKHHTIATNQVTRNTTLREATLEDMEFMRGDIYDNDPRSYTYTEDGVFTQ